MKTGRRFGGGLGIASVAAMTLACAVVFAAPAWASITPVTSTSDYTVGGTEAGVCTVPAPTQPGGVNFGSACFAVPPGATTVTYTISDRTGNTSVGTEPSDQTNNQAKTGSTTVVGAGHYCTATSPTLTLAVPAGDTSAVAFFYVYVDNAVDAGVFSTANPMGNPEVGGDCGSPQDYGTTGTVTATFS